MSKQQLAKILEDYQEQIGNTTAYPSLKKLDRCVVTGQQVGFMGGPLYTISKAISCILLARKLDAAPIFWCATEDHDVHEVKRATVLDAGGDLKHYTVSLPEGHFVEDLPLTAEHKQTIEQFCSDLNIPTWDYSERYAETMIRLLVKLFEGTGLLFLEPYLLRPLAHDFFAQELHNPSPLSSEGPIKPTETHLFYKTDEGRRLKVEGTDVPIESLSTSVVTRPVLQSLLIPTEAYVGGPTEIAYHKQLDDVFKAHNVKCPKLYPRLSLTLIPPGNHSIHYMQNLIRPRERKQERVLNFLMFQTTVQSLLDQLTWHPGASTLLRGQRPLL